MNKTAILIINWNDYQNTKECLDSLIINNPKSSYSIIIIDNNSKDWSREKLIQKYWLTEFTPNNWNCEKNDIFIKDVWFDNYNWWNICLKLNDNFWFTWANNFWMKFAHQHDFKQIIWLNNDTIVTEWFIHNLEKWLEKYPHSLLSCRIVFYPDTDYIWFLWSHINSIWKPIWTHYQEKSDTLVFDRYIQSELCTWCLMLFSIETLKKLWWQDNNYFFNIDDADYSYDAKLKWINTIIDTSTVLYHKSARSMVWKPWLSMYYWLRNLIYFRKKFFHWYKNIAIFLYVIIHSFWVFIIYWLKWTNTTPFFIDLFSDIKNKRYGKYSKQK